MARVINTFKRTISGKKGNALSFLKLALALRKLNLSEFTKRHDELFKKAMSSQDYAPVTKHYYALMASLIEEAYGTSLHFTPPDYRGQSLEEAILSMHLKIGKILEHYSPPLPSQNGANKKFIDLGCSIGGIMRDIAKNTGHRVIGITLGHNEVEMNNEMNREAGLQDVCQAIQGDINNIEIQEKNFEGAYAIYALKYFCNLSPIFASVSKILKNEGVFLIYDIIKTDQYSDDHVENKKIVSDFEYACGMPPLHTQNEMCTIAKQHGFTLTKSLDLCEYEKEDHTLPWYYFFDRGMLKFLLNSKLIYRLSQLAEKIGILPKGYQEFSNIFIQGTVQKIVEAGKRNILSGSKVLIFKKLNS